MQVTVTFRHIDSSDPLKKYAVDKSERLSKYLLEPVEIHWVLNVEKIRHTAAATISAGGVKIKAQEETSDLYSAIDLVIDKLEKQLRKHKEKAKDHHKEDAASGLAPDLSVVPAQEGSAGNDEDAQEKKPRVVSTENVFIKPMSVEEATMQMEVVDNDFLVFTNSSTNHVNVLYSRPDGNYGLIETVS